MGTKFARRLRRQRHIGLSFDSLALLALHHARLTADDAASGRAGASGASATCLSMRVCRRSAAGHAQGPRDADPPRKLVSCLRHIALVFRDACDWLCRIISNIRA